MPTEVETLAYERFRNFARGDFVRVEIGNSDMSVSTVREVGAGNGPEWTTTDANNPQIVEMVIRGDHGDVDTGVTYARVRVRRASAAGAGIVFDDTFDPVAINEDDDQLTVRVNMEVPEIVA